MAKNTEITDAQLGAAVRTVFAALFASTAAINVTPTARPTATGGAQNADTTPASSGSATDAPTASPETTASTPSSTEKQSDASSSTPDQAKAEGPTSQDVLKAVLAYAGETSKAQAEAVLAKFDGAKRVGELKPENYQAVLDAIEEAKSASSLA